VTGETMVSKATVDPTVQKAGILDMARLYLNAADPRSPLAAPIYADLTGLAPLLVQVGAAETLLDDAIRLARVAGAADVRVDLQIWPEMIHVWHLFHPELKAGQRAIEVGGTFVRAHTAVAFGRARYPLGAVCRDQVLDLALGRTREIEA